MSGIFGACNLDGDSLPIDSVRACVNQISPERSYDVRIRNLSAAIRDEKISSDADDGLAAFSAPAEAQVVCVFDGRLDNREDLSARLRDRRPVDDASTDADLV